MSDDQYSRDGHGASAEDFANSGRRKQGDQDEDPRQQQVSYPSIDATSHVMAVTLETQRNLRRLMVLLEDDAGALMVLEYTMEEMQGSGCRFVPGNYKNGSFVRQIF